MWMNFSSIQLVQDGKVSNGAVSIFTGLVVLAGVLISLVITLLTLCILHKKRRRKSDYTSVDNDKVYEHIPLKGKKKVNLNSLIFDEESMSEDELMQVPFTKAVFAKQGFQFQDSKETQVVKSIYRQMPKVENSIIPTTIAIPVQSQQADVFVNVSREKINSTGVHGDTNSPEYSYTSAIEGNTNLPILVQSSENHCSITVPEKSDNSTNVNNQMLFEDDSFNDDIDCTIVQEDEKSSILLKIPPPLPANFKMPIDIIDSDKPATGLLAFSLSLRRLNVKSDPISLLVHVFEARCILSAQVSRGNWFGPGRFYIKARLQAAGSKDRMLSSVMNSSSLTSVSSLDQGVLSRPLFSKSFTKKQSEFRTHFKSACRTVRFIKTIEIPLPRPWKLLIEKTNCSHPDSFDSKFSRKRSISDSNLDSQSTQFLLKLTLKQREISNLFSKNKKSTSKNFQIQLPYKMELGTVTVQLSSNFLKLIDVGPTPNGKAVPACSTLKPFIDQQDGYTPVSQPGLLRMVREFDLLPQGLNGTMNLALRWNQITKQLTCRAIDCTSICFPLATKKIVACFALMNNNEVLQTIQSKDAGKLSLNECEFQLADDVLFNLDTFSACMANVCLGVAIVATLSGVKTREILIGRFVAGPDGLAYGSGLRHWNEVILRRGMIRRRHWIV